MNFTVTSGSTIETPIINSINPLSGGIGTQIWISGSGFNSNTDVEMDTESVGKNNIILVNSTQLYFMIPSYTNPNVHCLAFCGALATKVTPKAYNVTVTNDPKSSYQSNNVLLTVTQ